jgi:DNA-binding transcriptional LysR family regulator
MADGISDAEFFIGIAQAGGIGAGALALNSSPPAASRRLATIERRLGVQLAERSARRFRLTDEGRLYLERSHELLSAMRDMEAEVSSRGESARGLLRVAAPTDLGRRRLAPTLAAFADAHPELTVQLILSDSGVEIAEDGLDIAIRTGVPHDPAVIVRKLVTAPMKLCAAPAYLARHGTPREHAELSGHRCLVLARRHQRISRWRFRASTGEVRDVEITGRLSSTSGDVLRQWAIDGAGISLEAEWDVEADLAEGRLIECLPDVRWEPVSLYATFMPGRPVAPRVRLAIDWIADTFSAGDATAPVTGKPE